MRGGARKGAGRKKGSKSKKHAAAILEAQIATGDEMPLEYMLRVMRDKTADPRRRDGMAVAAAAYAHPRLSAVEMSGDPERPLETITRIELVAG